MMVSSFILAAAVLFGYGHHDPVSVLYCAGDSVPGRIIKTDGSATFVVDTVATLEDGRFLLQPVYKIHPEAGILITKDEINLMGMIAIRSAHDSDGMGSTFTETQYPLKIDNKCKVHKDGPSIS